MPVLQSNKQISYKKNREGFFFLNKNQAGIILFS